MQRSQALAGWAMCLLLVLGLLYAVLMLVGAALLIVLNDGWLPSAVHFYMPTSVLSPLSEDGNSAARQNLHCQASLCLD